MSWSTKKQVTVSHFSSEVEYCALVTIVAEVRWFSFLFCELDILLYHPPSLLCDNLSTLQITRNPIFHARTQYIEINYHFVCELVQRQSLRLAYVSTNDQLADLFTKGLSRLLFDHLCSKMRLRFPPSRLGGRVKAKNLKL